MVCKELEHKWRWNNKITAYRCSKCKVEVSFLETLKKEDKCVVCEKTRKEHDEDTSITRICSGFRTQEDLDNIKKIGV